MKAENDCTISLKFCNNQSKEKKRKRYIDGSNMVPQMFNAHSSFVIVKRRKNVTLFFFKVIFLNNKLQNEFPPPPNIRVRFLTPLSFSYIFTVSRSIVSHWVFSFMLYSRFYGTDILNVWKQKIVLAEIDAFWFVFFVFFFFFWGGGRSVRKNLTVESH